MEKLPGQTLDGKDIYLDKDGAMVLAWPDHKAEPVETDLHVLICRVCGKPVRTASGGRFPIHARVV